MDTIIPFIESINRAVNEVVWGPFMLTLMIATGLFLSIRTDFAQISRFGYAIRNTIGAMFSKKQRTSNFEGVSPFQAVATAMAGTIGTGSIAGIATAIVSGGAGAVFWMWVSAVLGMVTKFSEILLSIKFREKNQKGEWVGGPMYYINKGIKIKWLAKVLAMLFSFFAIFACLGTGNATQSNSIAGALKSTMHVNPTITGIVLTAIVAFVILGGVKRIASINEKLVPFMAVFFVCCSIGAIIVNFKKVPDAFALIFREAFNFKAAVGGAAGYGIMTAMKFGFSRGVFTNEAGLGSAPIAHAASNTKEPVEQAFWGMFEVFFTTIIICTLSALTIITTELWQTGELSGAALSIASFNKILPGIGSIIVTMATILFALSTILGWAYYGEVSVEYISRHNQKAVILYRIVYVIIVYVGAVGSLDLIWSISETMNGLMAIPNLIGLLSLSAVVAKTTKEYFDENSVNSSSLRNSSSKVSEKVN